MDEKEKGRVNRWLGDSGDIQDKQELVAERGG